MTALPAPGSPPVVDMRGVGRRYPGSPPVDALLDISLSIREGEFVAVVGPSGSGKSTLLNVLGLLVAPTSGRYLLDGVDVARAGKRRLARVRAARLGFVFQGFHLLPHLPAVENVALGGLYFGMPTKERNGRAVELLDRVGLSHRRSALPSTLSGGERQRVAIARALVARPRLLLADEPTGNLDSGSAASVLRLFDDLHREGTTIAMITHDTAVAHHASRQVRIVDGRIQP